ncbi:hypothetical protein DFAR_1040005 [Desulfarculales bacterium]
MLHLSWTALAAGLDGDGRPGYNGCDPDASGGVPGEVAANSPPPAGARRDDRPAAQRGAGGKPLSKALEILLASDFRRPAGGGRSGPAAGRVQRWRPGLPGGGAYPRGCGSWLGLAKARCSLLESRSRKPVRKIISELAVTVGQDQPLGGAVEAMLRQGLRRPCRWSTPAGCWRACSRAGTFSRPSANRP